MTLRTGKRKLIRIIFILVIVVTACLYPKWYIRQIHKVQGIYYVAKGDNYLRKTKFHKAINEYKHGLELYPEHYGAWFNLGNIYVVYEDYYASIDAYAQAIKYNPNYVLARMNYGIISAEKFGDFDSAIEQYNKVIEIQRKPVYIPFVFNNLTSYKTNIGLAYYNKGVAYRQKSMYTDADKPDREYNLLKAIEAFKMATKIMKKDYDSWYNLALAYHLNRDFNLAGLAYCRAIELSPMSYEAHYNLAVLLSHLKYYKEALKEMQKANNIISSADGSSNHSRYMFDVMSDVTRNILKDEEGMKFLAEDNEYEATSVDGGLIYLNGRVVASDELDKSMMKNLSKCPSRDFFRDEDRAEELLDGVFF